MTDIYVDKQYRYPREREPLLSKIVEGIILSFAIMGMFIGLQMMISVAATLGVSAAYAAKTGCDMQIALLFSAKFMTTGSFMTGLTVAATAISALFSVSFYWMIWGRKKTEADRQYFKEKVLKEKPFIMISIAAVGLYYVAILIAELINVISPATMESYNELMEMSLGGSEILALLAAVILAPVNEECIMRGLILKNLQKFFSTPVVIIIQAVMFGIFHMNWVQGFYVLPIGAALGYVGVKSRSVFPCIYMHLFYNMMSFVSALLPKFCQTVLFSVFAAVVCAVVIWYMGKENYGKNEFG